MRPCMNIAGRQSQKEALAHAQTAFFVAIVVGQWAGLIICKTRLLSVLSQGMNNATLNFGLFFETLLCGYMCYFTPLHTALNTRPLRLTHWAPAFPFFIFIVLYDELKKAVVRATTKVRVHPVTGRVEREQGWVERNMSF